MRSYNELLFHCVCVHCYMFAQPEPLPEITAPGFLGYAVDLMQVRPGMELMRHALLDLFKDLSVWSTAAEARAHQASRTAAAAQQQRAVQIGDNVQIGPNVHEPLNFVSLDRKARLAPGRVCISHWRFRPHPFADTSESMAAAVKHCRTAYQAACKSRLDLCGSESDDDSDGSCESEPESD
jgi:hypothetical protein